MNKSSRVLTKLNCTETLCSALESIFLQDILCNGHFSTGKNKHHDFFESYDSTIAQNWCSVKHRPSSSGKRHIFQYFNGVLRWIRSVEWPSDSAGPAAVVSVSVLGASRFAGEAQKRQTCAYHFTAFILDHGNEALLSCFLIVFGDVLYKYAGKLGQIMETASFDNVAFRDWCVVPSRQQSACSFLLLAV